MVRRPQILAGIGAYETGLFVANRADTRLNVTLTASFSGRFLEASPGVVGLHALVIGRGPREVEVHALLA